MNYNSNSNTAIITSVYAYVKNPEPIIKNRVIGFIDIDSFECQLWQRKDQFIHTRGRPCVVVNSSDRVLSATYEAKKLGVSRDKTPVLKRPDLFPDLIVFKKRDEFGKPESRTTREGTDDVYNAIKNYCSTRHLKNVTIEVQPSDGFYLDLSNEVDFLSKIYKGKNIEKERDKKLIISSNDVYGYCDKDLILGAYVIMGICKHIEKTTKLKSSAGVSRNKLVAKIACGLNRPQKCTILENGYAFERISEYTPLSKINGLGGDKGESLMNRFKITTISQLKNLRCKTLVNYFVSDYGVKVFNWARGQDDTPVVDKILNKKMRINKPSRAIQSYYRLIEVVNDLCDELFSNYNYETSKHSRFFDQFRLDFTFVDHQGNDQNCSTYFDVSWNGAFDNLSRNVVRFIKNCRNFDSYNFSITELSFSIQKFHTIQNK